MSWKTQEFIDIPEDILAKCKSMKVTEEDILLEYDSKVGQFSLFLNVIFL